MVKRAKAALLNETTETKKRPVLSGSILARKTAIKKDLTKSVHYFLPGGINIKRKKPRLI